MDCCSRAQYNAPVHEEKQEEISRASLLTTFFPKQRKCSRAKFRAAPITFGTAPISAAAHQIWRRFAAGACELLCFPVA
jgi:hypothetical protein